MSRHAVEVILGLTPTTENGEFVIEVEARITAMGTTGLPYVAVPGPTTVLAETHLEKFKQDAGLAKNHAAGTAAQAKISKAVVIKDMKKWKVQVQTAVDAAPDLATAILIAQSCHFPIKDVSSFSKAPFTIRNAGIGIVWLIAKVIAKHQAWVWEISTDGITYTFLECTLEANFLATGLTSGRRYWFRCRAILPKKAGTQPFSVALDIVVT